MITIHFISLHRIYYKGINADSTRLKLGICIGCNIVLVI